MEMGKSDVKEVLSKLNREGLDGSAELWAWFVIGCSESGSGRVLEGRPETWAALGDSLYAQGRFLSAVEKYKQSLSMLSARGPTGVQLRTKIARCYVRHGDKKAALRTLEAIREGEFSVEAEFLLGQLYLDSGVTKAAHVCFRNVLQRQPLALQAALFWVESGGPVDEIVDIIASGFATTTMKLALLTAIKQFFTAMGLLVKQSLESGCRTLEAVEKLAPNSAPVAIRLAEAEYERYISSGDMDARERSLGAFKRAKIADPWLMRSMDDYGSLLAELGRSTELTALGASLLEVDPISATAWRSAALLCELNKEHGRAKKLDAQLHRVNERESKKLHAPVVMKASTHISLAKLQLSTGSLREAHLTAKEAIRQAPKSAVAYCVYARVMSAFDRHEKSRAAYEKALRLYPGCLEAVTGLARCQESDKEIEAAVETLKRYIDSYENNGARGYRSAVVRVRVELASILSSDKQLEAATEQIHLALKAEPQNALALQEAEALETVIRDATGEGEPGALGLDSVVGQGAPRGNRRRGARTLDFEQDVDDEASQDRPDPIEFANL